jgi:hypothetical protein
MGEVIGFIVVDGKVAAAMVGQLISCRNTRRKTMGEVIGLIAVDGKKVCCGCSNGLKKSIGLNVKKTKQVPATKKRTANKMKMKYEQSCTTNQKTWQSTIAYVSLNKGGSLRKEGQSTSK